MPLALQVLLGSMLSLPVSLMDAWDAVASARLAARLKVVKAAGDPVTMAELAKRYPDPPPGRNAADLLNAAFKKMEGRNEGPEGLPIVGPAVLPDVTADLPPAMRLGIQAFLKENADVLELLHKAAALDDCKFGLDFAQGLQMPLPHLAQMRSAARLLALEAIERTEGGNADEAAASLVAALRMGECVRREPILISALVRIACNFIAVGQMERWASRARPSPAALERLEAALAAAADPRMIEGAMVGERCFGIDAYQNQVLKPERRGELLGELGALDEGLAPLVLRLVPDAYFKMDMSYYLDIMNDFVAATRKPFPESYLAGAKAGRDMEQRIPRCYVVSRQILPALGRTFTEGQKHIARCDSARVALAALRYRAKHGRLPNDLNALVPGFLKAVPPDPFDGKPLRYRAEATGLTVYAVGEDAKDDGGAVQAAPQGKPADVGFRLRWPKTQF